MFVFVIVLAYVCAVSLALKEKEERRAGPPYNYYTVY